MLSEFGLINRYFKRPAGRSDVVVSVGDDGAVIEPPVGYQLVQTMDTMVETVHFLPDVAPFDLGYKLLAVNLSDLAAMGAKPAWALLSLTLPDVQSEWLEAFSNGLFYLADQHRVAIVGGDTCRGPRSLSMQLTGLVPKGQYLTRAGAGPGDSIFLSGTIGDAGLALAQLLSGEGAPSELLRPLLRPVPRVELGLGIRDLASAAIDISDGLAADLGHLLDASRVGAEIDLQKMPLSDAVRERVTELRDWSLPLSSGDDYELCFTLPDEKEGQMIESLAGVNVPVTKVGKIKPGQGINWLGLAHGWKLSAGGFDHFPEPP